MSAVGVPDAVGAVLAAGDEEAAHGAPVAREHRRAVRTPPALAAAAVEPTDGERVL